MFSILTLPTEVKLLVFAQLDLADKAAVALTCKTLNQVMTPAMFEYIDLEWSESYYPKCDLLLRTVLGNRKRADQVLQLRFAGGEWSDEWGMETYYGPESGRVQRLIHEAGLSDIVPLSIFVPCSPMHCLLKTGESIYADLYQAMIVSQLPNLHTLKIGRHEIPGLELLSKAIQHTLCLDQWSPGRTRFHHLQYIDLCYGMNRRDLAQLAFESDFYSSDLILPFFYMPEVKRLRAMMPSFGQPFDPEPHLLWPCRPPCAHTLTSLTLHRSGIEPCNLAEVLQITPNLCHLTYDHIVQLERRLSGALYGVSLNNYCLGAALEGVARTLESLVICIQFYEMCGPRYGMEDFQSSISGYTSFAGLVKLQRLEVPLMTLLGPHPGPYTFPIERLPPNIRHLSLTDDLAMHHYFPWRSSSVLELFPHDTSFNKRLANGNLAVIEVILRESDGDWSIKSKIQLDDTLNRAGIVCEFTHLLAVRFPWD